MNSAAAVAVFRTPDVKGDVLFTHLPNQHVSVTATFTAMPPGAHGFHIHKAGDLRGEGCMGLCEHYDVGHHSHGDGPHSSRERHTGDLGNLVWKAGQKTMRRHYVLTDTSIQELWGRSIILHADKDDLGLGSFEDSKTTGHSGKRMACAIIGRVACPVAPPHALKKGKRTTRRLKLKHH